MSATKIIRAKVRLPAGVIVNTQVTDSLLGPFMIPLRRTKERLESNASIDLELEIPVEHTAAAIEALEKLAAEIVAAK